jgi:hypothetical protein
VSEELDIGTRYRQRAEELRMIAADEEVASTRKILLAIAADYERMADTTEVIDKTNRAMNSPR